MGSSITLLLWGHGMDVAWATWLCCSSSNRAHILTQLLLLSHNYHFLLSLCNDILLHYSYGSTLTLPCPALPSPALACFVYCYVGLQRPVVSCLSVSDLCVMCFCSLSGSWRSVHCRWLPMETTWTWSYPWQSNGTTSSTSSRRLSKSLFSLLLLLYVFIFIFTCTIRDLQLLKLLKLLVNWTTAS